MRELTHRIRFAANFLLHPSRNASVVPSSPRACRAMFEGIDFSAVTTVVELGPGTGVFTKELLKLCKPDTAVLLIEIEASYIRNLREQFGDRVIIEQGSAHLLDRILMKHRIGKVDMLISSLPFSLPQSAQGTLLASIKKHTHDGTVFRFFTYNPPLMKRAYKSLPIRKISFVPRNFPPLWVYGIH